MPSPVGHALGALAAGWVASGTAGDRRAILQRSLWLVAIGLAPDLDLLIGRHSRETHSLGAAVIVAAVAAAMRWPVADTRWRIFCAVALAWMSHPILDALGADSSPPYGVMMLWPLSYEHYLSSISVFEGISRRWWLPGFVAGNLLAVAREVAVLGPVALVSWIFTRRRARRLD